ncbi:glycerate-2-kinase family protein, partial [Enterocloster bolteae]|uniref:glycerate-2-kinase family protein n=1 Tax=Enterocloster bolteae TaxID=208479 RepID=UPI002A7F5061
MGKIKNTESLLNHGDRESRKKITELLERMWAKVDAYHLIKELMSVDGNCLTIGTRRWDMDKLGNIYLFGAGKACNAMAMAVCDVLKEKLTEGVISVKIAEDNDTYINTRVYVGGHPLPNEEGYRAAEDIIQMIDKGKPGDLFISVISGGSSALLTCPKEGITLQEEIQAQDMLLRSGAKIEEINAVRRHISRTNGGRLTEQVLKNGAEIVNIIVGDGVGVKPTVDFKAPFQFFGTPVAPDKTTIQDARDCIRNY